MLPVEENTRLKDAVITFRPQGGHVSLSEPRGFFERSSSFCKRFVIKLGHIGQCFYHDIYVPCFMNSRRVLDLLEFKNRVSQCLRPSDGGRVFEIHSHSFHGT